MWPLIRLASYWAWFTEQWARRIPVRSLRYTNLSCVSVLEYAAPVWNRYLVKDVFALERVQRRASRLKTRWLFLSSAECCMIVFDDFNKPNFDNLFEFTKCDSTRANYPYKLHVKLAKCNLYNFPFLSESYRTEISHQDSSLRLEAWVALRVRWSAF